MSREQAQAILLGMAVSRLNLTSGIDSSHSAHTDPLTNSPPQAGEREGHGKSLSCLRERDLERGSVYPYYVVKSHQPSAAEQGAKAALFRAAKRAALVGYCHQHDPEQLKAASQNFPNPVAAIGIAYLVKLALDDIPPQKWLSLLYEFTEGISEELEAALLRVGHVEGWVNRQAALRHINRNETLEEAVTIALYAVRQFPDEFRAALQLGMDGSRTVPTQMMCITGSISAARLGMDAVPSDAISPRHRNRLMALGAQLAEKR